MTGSVRTAIVEDHGLFRETIAAVVASMPQLELDGVYSSAEDAVAAFADDQPDMVLLDLSLSGMSGVELVAEVHERWPHVICIVLSGHRREVYAEQALAAGARGYILKGSPKRFREGISQVLEGHVYVSDQVQPNGDV
jgi:DNA-binding NarL/FixJ family response regulator